MVGKIRNAGFAVSRKKKEISTVLVPSGEGLAFNGKLQSIAFQLSMLRHDFGPDDGHGSA